jgi:hypothetical protein
MARRASSVILAAQQLLLSPCRMSLTGSRDGMLGTKEHSEQHQEELILGI